MLEKDINNTEVKYVSHIKINGIPILPPLITSTKRKEIHKYKHEAIRLEKQLKQVQDLKSYINTYYTSKVETHTIPTSLEHKLAFEDENNVIKSLSETCLSEKDVPSAVKKKTPQLCCDIQVSQYTNNEFTVLTNFEQCKSDVKVIDDFTLKYYDNPSYNINDTDTIADTLDKNKKPRLIRSNSYILDSPSPMLLEHLRKQCKSSDIEVDDYTISQSDYIQEACVYTSQDDFSFTDLNNIDTSRSESELKDLSTFSNQNSDNVTIIDNQRNLKEFIDNNVPHMLGNNLFLSKSIISNFDPIDDKIDSSIIPNSHTDNMKDNLQENTNVNYDNESLMTVLNNIPEIYSKQILELLDKQQQEQLSKQHTLFSSDKMYVNSDLQNNNPSKTSNSYYFSQNLELTKVDKNSQEQSIDITVELDHILVRCDEDNKFLEIPAKFSMSPKKLKDRTILNCSRKLFANTSNETIKQLPNEEYAASIIGAAARGYLVRRLMRTDRVQGLIQTIRDALICAMQLHTENTDSINESDVELHRRLIQQVSAACFEFHDFFFCLTINEQMNIIRLDRERQKEKLKRPRSRVSSAGKSSRTSKFTRPIR